MGDGDAGWENSKAGALHPPESQVRGDFVFNALLRKETWNARGSEAAASRAYLLQQGASVPLTPLCLFHLGSRG